MKKSLILSLLIGLGVASAPVASMAANNDSRAGWEAAFKKADADGSGGLSKAELDKAGPKAFPNIKKNFDAMDGNKDGQVTMAERDAFVNSRKQAREAKAAKAPAK